MIGGTVKSGVAALLTRFIMGVVLSFLAAFVAFAQQVPDNSYHFENDSPAFAKNSGPKLVLDKLKSPFVQRGSFDPFLKIARDDGFQTGYLETKVDKTTLGKSQLLVIINSYRRDFAEFSAMEPPSAYEDSEIEAIFEWVMGGGRLLLIADHSPFSGGTAKLAEKFGFTFFNGMVLEEAPLPFRNGIIRYHTSYGLNGDSPLLKGGYVKAPIERFMIFTGSAFIPPPQATSVLTIPKGFVALIMKRTLRDLTNVPKINVAGLSQGATMELGKGRIAVFGEAASFSAQTINELQKHGMNNPQADQNPYFVLATLRWLAEGL